LGLNSFAIPGDDCTTAILVSSNGCSTTSQYSNVGITGTIDPSFLVLEQIIQYGLCF